MEDTVILLPNLEPLATPVIWEDPVRVFHPVWKAVTEPATDSVEVISAVIPLTDDDIPVKEANWEDLPDTISVMCNLLRDTEDGRYKVHIKSAGGSCAGNLLGRFCHLDPQLSGLVKEIADTEQRLHPDIIYAEIAHLPESRIGNIAARPLLRDYEIHYLAQSGVEAGKQIPVSDLMLSVSRGRVVLKSRKFGKEVMPRLTNAHNYSFNSMPIYHFLCDMQMFCGNALYRSHKYWEIICLRQYEYSHLRHWLHIYSRNQ